MLYSINKKTKLYCIPINIFNSAKEQSHELQVLYNSLIEDVVVQQLEREIDILTNSPQECYQRVLKRSPTLFQEIPALHIAAYLRMTPETLSRIRKS